MARVTLEKKIHFYYDEIIVELWNQQTEEFKQICEDVGRPKGYTGINTFVLFLNNWAMFEKTGYVFKNFIRG